MFPHLFEASWKKKMAAAFGQRVSGFVHLCGFRLLRSHHVFDSSSWRYLPIIQIGVEWGMLCHAFCFIPHSSLLASTIPCHRWWWVGLWRHSAGQKVCPAIFWSDNLHAGENSSPPPPHEPTDRGVSSSEKYFLLLDVLDFHLQGSWFLYPVLWSLQTWNSLPVAAWLTQCLPTGFCWKRETWPWASSIQRFCPKAFKPLSVIFLQAQFFFL